MLCCFVIMNLQGKNFKPVGFQLDLLALEPFRNKVLIKTETKWI